VRTDRVLHTGAEAAEDQRHGEHREPNARSGEEIADPGKRCPQTEDERSAEALGESPGRHLEAGHRADIERTQQPDFGIAEAELGLPQRQQHVEQVGKAVMQHMGPRSSCRLTLASAARVEPGLGRDVPSKSQRATVSKGARVPGY
jgi:hypothetical protein